MHVNLGSVEVDDQTAALIHRAMNPYTRARKQRATRREIVAWTRKVLADEIDVLREAFPEIMEVPDA